nr:hypothetical protein CFP56_47702 [Quercus suber]
MPELKIDYRKLFAAVLLSKVAFIPTVDGLVVATSSDGPAATQLEIISTGFSSDGAAVAPMEIIFAGFCSDGPAVALSELSGYSSNGASFDEAAVVPSNIDLANLQLSKGRFLAETGFVDFRVNKSSEPLSQGADNEGTRQTVNGKSISYHIGRYSRNILYWPTIWYV